MNLILLKGTVNVMYDKTKTYSCPKQLSQISLFKSKLTAKTSGIDSEIMAPASKTTITLYEQLCIRKTESVYLIQLILML